MWYNSINWWFFGMINCAIGLVFFVAMSSPWWALFWVPAGIYAAYEATKLNALWLAAGRPCPYCTGGMVERRTDDNLFTYMGTCAVCNGTGTKQQ